MEALLILAGVLLLASGWIWLVVASMRQSVSRMILALLFGPLTLLLPGLGYPLWPRLVILLGLVGLLAGGVWLQHQHPERMEQLVSGNWQSRQQAPGSLQGSIMGQTFQPNRITWQGDDLVLEERLESRIRRALTIRFGNAKELLHQPVIERLPGDAGAWPELILRWHTGVMSEPGLRRVSGDYSLSLAFLPAPEGRVVGHIHLQLPAGHASWLGGQFQLPAPPRWMAEQQHPGPPAGELAATEQAAPVPPPLWHELSPQAIMQEPERFSGSKVRLTTEAGRVHEGVFKELSADRRLVLSIPQGASQVELHFRLLDVVMIEQYTGH